MMVRDTITNNCIGMVSGEKRKKSKAYYTCTQYVRRSLLDDWLRMITHKHVVVKGTSGYKQTQGMRTCSGSFGVTVDG